MKLSNRFIQLFHRLTHSHTMTHFDGSGKEAFLKTVWEKEKLLVQAISPFCTMFSPLSKTEITFFVTFNLSSANAFNLVWSNILLFGNGLKRFFVTSAVSQNSENQYCKWEPEEIVLSCIFVNEIVN